MATRVWIASYLDSTTNLEIVSRTKLRYLVAMLLFGLLLAAVSSGSSSQVQQSTSPAAEKKTFIVGTDGQFPPFSYLNPDGSIQGFDSDSIRWIAEREGFSVKFQMLRWDEMIPALLAKEIDIIYAGMTITPERAERVSFSLPYWEMKQEVVARSDSTITLADVEGGKASIGTQSGSTAEVWIDKNLIDTGKMPESQLKIYDNTPLALDDLVAGRIDAVIYDQFALRDMIADKPIKKIGTIETDEQLGVAVRKSDTGLLAMINDGIYRLKADPYWHELIVKYNMT
jgi:polar amino acid transport system substrate-binding protein